MVGRFFDVIFLDEATSFLRCQDRKAAAKIMANIRKSQIHMDTASFKKLNAEIWEFRTLYNGVHYRTLAFWDKTSSARTIVIATHGFVKKQSKVPDSELARAWNLRNEYFLDKQTAK